VKPTIAAVVLLLLAPTIGRGAAASTQDAKSAAVAQPAADTAEASDHAAVVALRQRPRGQTAGLLALFGSLAVLGLIIARTASSEPHRP